MPHVVVVDDDDDDDDDDVDVDVDGIHFSYYINNDRCRYSILR
jgi:hypothetical protein